MKNFFRKLLPSKPAPLTLEQQIKSLDEQSQDFLANLVRTATLSENDSALRLAATERLSFGTELIFFAADEHTKPEVKKVARLKIAKMLDDKSISLTDLSEKMNNNHVLIAITLFCKNNEFQEQLLSSVTDASTLRDLCLSNIPVATKQMLAERISDEPILKELARAAKSKEKAVYKIVKAKLDKLKALEQARIDAANHIQQTLAEIQHHAQRQVDVVYRARLDVLVARWEGLKNYVSQNDGVLFDQARDQCLELVAAKAKDVTGDNVSNKTTSDASSSGLIPSLHDASSGPSDHMSDVVSREDDVSVVSKKDLAPEIIFQANDELKKMWDLILPLFVSDDITWTEVSAQVSTLNTDWDLLFDGYSKDLMLENTRSNLLKGISLIEEYTTRYGALHVFSSVDIEVATIDGDLTHSPELFIGRVKLLDKLIRVLSKVPDVDFTEEMESLKNRVNIAQKAISDKRQEDEKNIRIIGSLIRKASTNVEKGQLKTAVGMRRSMQVKIDTLAKTPSFLARQIEDLDVAIAKLIDWQSYAVLPKKEALVKSMQQLVGLDVPADALAVKIKKLQDEWRELQQSGKGEDETLWQQFKGFSDAAYEPCKAYFQELAQVRQDNLAKRQRVVNQLRDFDTNYDWEKADWKMVENVLRTARKEFRDYAPVERASNEQVSAEFDAVADTIFARITAEREKNKLAKEQLILQVKTLEKNTDISQAINGVKRLQSQWKTIGQCHYRDNDVLWAAFRESCDAIFSKKHEQDMAAKSVIDASITRANDIISTVKALSELLPSQPQVAGGELQQLRSDFSAIGDLPEPVARAVTRDFNAAVDSIQSAIGSSHQQLKESAWQDVFSLSAEMNSLIRLNESDREEVIASIDRKIADIRWPEGAKQPVLAKFASCRESGVSDDDLAVNTKALRILCIRAEMLSNTTSPESDSALRMEYQMSLLKDGIRYQKDSESILALAIDWLSVGAADMTEYDTLFKRFYASWSGLSV